MRLFGRKRQEDVEEDIKKDSDKPKRRRRKKEEPPKPWGRSERYLVFGVLFSTIIVAIGLALNARSWKLPGLPRIGLPKGVFEETYVLEGKPTKHDTSSIVNEFNALTKDLSGVYGFYVMNLNTDETYGVNETEVFQAASLIKLPVMLSMYVNDEEGKIDLDDVYTLIDADKVNGSGGLIYKEAGSKYSYRELVNLMGQQSDNTAFNVSVKLLGEEYIEEFIASLGMENTSYKTNETTPLDIGIFFKKLWAGKLIERKSRDEILKSLTETIYEDFIPKGISDIRIAHKFGRELHVVNDAGIVFSKNPYILVIMSKGILEPEADEFIPAFASAVHRFETQERK